MGARKKNLNRSRAEASGREAELFAAAWYEGQGYDVLAQRVRTALGEIDLVVATSEILIFAEVKARVEERSAAEAVTRRQQARLIGAAEIILAEHPGWGRELTRFDVILVVSGAIVAIPDAFRADQV
jgi:putative endonuclease